MAGLLSERTQRRWSTRKQWLVLALRIPPQPDRALQAGLDRPLA